MSLFHSGFGMMVSCRGAILRCPSHFRSRAQAAFFAQAWHLEIGLVADPPAAVTASECVLLHM